MSEKKIYIRSDIIKAVLSFRNITYSDIADPENTPGKETISRTTLWRAIFNKEKIKQGYVSIVAERLGIFDSTCLLGRSLESAISKEEIQPLLYETNGLHWEKPVFIQGGASYQIDRATTDEIQKRGENLCGSWRSYHISRRDGESKVIESKVTLKNDGSCEMEYLCERPKYTYSGIYCFEGENRLLLILDCSSGQMAEKAIFRYRYTPGGRNVQLIGNWFGIDPDFKPVSSGCILLNLELTVDSKDYAVELLLKTSDIWLSFPAEELSDEARLEERWMGDLVLDSISNCSLEDDIVAISTFFPEQDDLISCIRDLAAKAALMKLRRKPSVKILFLSPKCHSLFKSRFSIYRDNQFVSEKKITIGDLKKIINKFIDTKEQLARYYSENDVPTSSQLDLQLYSYESWAFSHIYKIGTKIYMGWILPTRSAIRGPMLVLDGKKSRKSWVTFTEEINSTIRNSKPIIDKF